MQQAAEVHRRLEAGQVPPQIDRNGDTYRPGPKAPGMARSDLCNTAQEIFLWPRRQGETLPHIAIACSLRAAGQRNRTFASTSPTRAGDRAHEIDIAECRVAAQQRFAP